MKTQQFPVKDPTIQRSFSDLYQYAHTHSGQTTEPKVNEGEVWSVVPVVLDGNYYLYVKFPTVGWKRFQSI